MQAFDTLYRYYYPLLSTYFPEIRKKLTEQELEIIVASQADNRKRLLQKKAQFVDYEIQSTLAIDSAMYLYMKNGFETMEKMPVSRYYNLLGADNSGLAFLEEKDLKEYFRLYEKFENEWITALAQPGCRAHAALPAYSRTNVEETNNRHTIRNSIFFFAEHDSTLSPKVPVMIDPISLIMLPSDASIEEFINEKRLEDLGFSYLRLGTENTLAYAKLKPTGKPDKLILFHLAKTIEEKQTFLSDYNPPEKRTKYKALDVNAGNGNKVYYTTEHEEDGDSLKVIKHFDAFAIIRGELVQISMTGDNVDLEDFKSYLRVIKW